MTSARRSSATDVKANPTWVLETSHDNFQLGFLLEWTDDIHGGDELFDGLIAAGLQDPGVNTSCRLFRVPGSLNDKKDRGSFTVGPAQLRCVHSFTRWSRWPRPWE